MSLADKFGFPAFRAIGDVFRGWIRARRGDAGGLDRIRAGIAGWRATGSRVVAPVFFGMLAEGCLATGRTAEGLDAVAEAIEFSEETGATHSVCDLYTLRGALLQQRDGAVDGPAADLAEEAYRRALDIAHDQRAKGHELRAAVGVASLWHAQGKTTEAGRLLDDVYGWFTEGFDTPDLVDARALRETLV